MDHSLHLFCEDALRRKLVIDCLQLFAYDGPDVLAWHDELAERIGESLGRCDRCIVQYYKSKQQWLESLRE